MREASRTQQHQNWREKQIYLLIPATRCSDSHTVLLKLIHVACNGTRQPGVYKQPGIIVRHCSWILVLLHTPEPLNVMANTVHNISIAMENEVLTQNHHVEQPLRNRSCRVIFYEKVSVDAPQRVLRVSKKAGGVSLISSIQLAVKVHFFPWPCCLETLITSPVLNCICVVGADAGASVLLLQLFPHGKCLR